MILDELRRLFQYEERHRRLLSRLTLALGLSAIVFVIGTLLIWATEDHQPGGAINGLGDASFFTATQLLSISSSLANPVSAAGRVVDVVLEAWAVVVVTAVAGSFATFFTSADKGTHGSE